jgi:hypothetical protein
MPFVNGEPRLFSRIASRQPVFFQRGPMREDFIKVLLDHGRSLRMPENLSHHIGVLVLPLIQKFLDARIARRGNTSSHRSSTQFGEILAAGYETSKLLSGVGNDDDKKPEKS